MKKKIIRIIVNCLIIVLLWSGVFPLLASLEEPYRAAKQGTVYEADDRLLRVETPSNAVYYRDSMLLDRIGETESSPELSLASALLAAAAYDEDNIGRAMDQMGYACLYKSPYYTEKSTHDNCNVVAYTVYEKYVDYKDELYRIICLPIRGTPATCEWYSNFDVGSGDRHEGFYATAEDVMENLLGILNQSPGKADHTVLWTTGHSRGAAVANIIAGELSTDGAWETSIPADHIIAYTYACPTVSHSADTTLTNIYNFNNGGDVVPAIPLKAWGFTRFGQTADLSESDYDNMCRRFALARGEEYGVGLSTDSWEAVLMDVAPTQQDFAKNDIVRLAVDILSWSMGGKQDRSYSLLNIISDHADSAIYIINLLAKILSTPRDIVEWLTEDTSPDSIMEKLDIGVIELELLVGELQQAVLDTADMNDISEWIGQNDELVERTKELTDITIKSKEDIEEACTVAEERSAGFSYVVETIKDVMFLFYDSEGNLIAPFTQGHSTDTYQYWVNSMYYGYAGWFEGKDPAISDPDDFKQKTYIGDYAFYGCQDPGNVSLPENIFIGKDALYLKKAGR